MSATEVERFFKDMAANPDLKSGVGEKTTMENLVSYAQSKGYQFSTNDVEALSARQQGKGELSDAQLEQVAGGGTRICASVGCIFCTIVGHDV